MVSAQDTVCCSQGQGMALSVSFFGKKKKKLLFQLRGLSVNKSYLEDLKHSLYEPLYCYSVNGPQEAGDGALFLVLVPLLFLVL